MESRVNSPFIDPDTGEIRDDAPQLSIENVGVIAQQIKYCVDKDAELQADKRRAVERITGIYDAAITKNENYRNDYIAKAQVIMDTACLEKKHVPGCGRFGWRKQTRKVFETPAWAALSATGQQDVAGDFGELFFKVNVSPVKAGIKEALVHDGEGGIHAGIEIYFALTPDDEKAFGFTVEKGD